MPPNICFAVFLLLLVTLFNGVIGRELLTAPPVADGLSQSNHISDTAVSSLPPPLELSASISISPPTPEPTTVTYLFFTWSATSTPDAFSCVLLVNTTIYILEQLDLEALSIPECVVTGDYGLPQVTFALSSLGAASAAVTHIFLSISSGLLTTMSLVPCDATIGITLDSDLLYRFGCVPEPFVIGIEELCCQPPPPPSPFLPPSPSPPPLYGPPPLPEGEISTLPPLSTLSLAASPPPVPSLAYSSPVVASTSPPLYQVLGLGKNTSNSPPPSYEPNNAPSLNFPPVSVPPVYSPVMSPPSSSLVLSVPPHEPLYFSFYTVKVPSSTNITLINGTLCPALSEAVSQGLTVFGEVGGNTFVVTYGSACFAVTTQGGYTYYKVEVTSIAPPNFNIFVSPLISAYLPTFARNAALRCSTAAITFSYPNNQPIATITSQQLLGIPCID